MSLLRVPALHTFKDAPTLGPQVAAWMQYHLVHGPGDIRGKPYRLDREKAGILMAAYSLQESGRRRFKRVGLSVRKGWAKTEFAAAVTAGELHPLAPVRFDHWAEQDEESEWLCVRDDGTIGPYIYRHGEPYGVGVSDPYIPMVAYTEDQSEELAYGALRVMLDEGPLAGDFDVGLERTVLLDDAGRAIGKAVPLATNPDSRDGARTSFQVFDETHRLVLPRHKQAHQTMMANLPKRHAADAWSLEITTSYEPGELSVAEGTMEYARKVKTGKVEAKSFFFYHRQAKDGYDLNDADSRKAAVIEASGPAAEWTDVDFVVSLYDDPTTDRSYWERVWLNRPVQGASQAFDMNAVDASKLEPIGRSQDGSPILWHPPARELIVVGFDGSMVRDATALVGTHIPTARQFLIGLWENPGNDPEWEVPQHEVDQAVDHIFDRWTIWRMYADPYYWDVHVAAWAGKYLNFEGKPAVFSWPTNTHKKMALSLKAYLHAMQAGEWAYDGDPKFREHLGNARKHIINVFDEDGQNLWVIRKERPDSPFKIDAAMAGCLSWEAYRDAIAAGVNAVPSNVPVSIF